MKTRPIIVVVVIVAIIAALLTLMSSTARAQTASQTVTFQVTGVNRISVSGNPATLTINQATAGSDLDNATDNSTTYSITTNQTNQKITGHLSAGTLPSGVTLKAALAGTPGTAVGVTPNLTSSPADLVTGITQAKATGKSITYTLSAALDAAVMGSTSNVTVTYTVTQGS